jgi:hypothetical protein
MKKDLLTFVLASVLLAACATMAPATPHTRCICARNYNFCVESYIGSRQEFCELHDHCSPQDWEALCRNDMRTCQEQFGCQ